MDQNEKDISLKILRATKYQILSVLSFHSGKRIQCYNHQEKRNCHPVIVLYCYDIPKSKDILVK